MTFGVGVVDTIGGWLIGVRVRVTTIGAGVRLNSIAWTRKILHYNLLEGSSGGPGSAAHGIRVPRLFRWPQIDISFNDVNEVLFAKMFTVKVSRTTFMSSR